jgi:hypothetical protein
LEAVFLVLAGFFLISLPLGRGVISIVLALTDQALLLYFSHCPAHFLIGTIFGIRFRYMLFSRSALAKTGGPLLGTVGKYLFTFVIVIDRSSLRSVSKIRIAAMHYAGTVTSMVLPFLVSLISLAHDDSATFMVSLVLALANVGFTLNFSPRTGDISRARAALGQTFKDQR